MATNVYFGNYQNSQEQYLIEDLIVESIRMYGMDMYYMPRQREAFDQIYGEDALSIFNKAFMLEMYIKNVDGFQGDGDFLSKFGLEIRDRITFTISQRVFGEESGAAGLELYRPKEGDLIFFPINNKIFEVKFVEHEAIFYQLGSLQTYDLSCELFQYSSERFNTGIEIIDQLYTNNYLTLNNFSQAITDFALQTEDTNPFYLLTEKGFKLVSEQYSTLGDNDAIEAEADAFIDFSESDPFSEGAY
jgi:hypothetical protein